MRKRNDPLRAFCTRRLGLETKGQKRWFAAAAVLLFLYLWLCQYLRYFLFDSVPSGVISIVLLSALQALPLCISGLLLFARIRIPVVSSDGQFPRLRRFFPVVAAVLTFGNLLLWLIAYYPGGFSYDSVSQLNQVLTGNYNNWHPVLHTWLFFWIPWQLFHTPAGIILYQIILFSLAVGYLYWVLSRRGCPMAFLVLSWLFLVINPQTAKAMMFPWKDSALTLVALVIFTQLIEIYDTDGAWLKKWHHFLSFSVLCFLATALRHNAILLTAPIYAILFIFQKKARKPILFSGLLVLFALLLLNGPVMTLAKVGAPGNRQTEVLGLPMTVLSEVYRETPEMLSDNAFGFMDSLATGEEWELYYQTGNFNTMKWNSSRPITDLIEHEGARNILYYTAQAFLNSPGYALRGFAALTQMVWNPVGFPGWSNELPYCELNNLGVAAQGSPQLAQIVSGFSDTTESFLLYLFTKNIGMMILIAMYAAVTNVGRGKLGRAFMVFPMLIYDFGTMLLLTGPDFRFFHFNFVIIIPLLYLILSGGRKHEAEAVT